MGPSTKFCNYPEINKFVLDTNSGIIRHSDHSCLALIGNKSKTKKVLNNIIERICINNCYLFDNEVVLRDDDHWSYDHPVPIVNERRIFDKKLVVFKPDNIPIDKMTPYLKSYIGGDAQSVFIRNNNYRPNSEIIEEETEYYMTYDVFKSNFVIELTPEQYNNSCISLKRRFQAVYL
tara:strand:- start:532 stop:1062 length:531 start_codon:yes stop_codon:yes gene_type:complete